MNATTSRAVTKMRVAGGPARRFPVIRIDIVSGPSLPPCALPVADHVDLIERLSRIPHDAMVRGVHFRGLDDELTRRGLKHRFDQDFPEPPRSTFTLYPARDYLVRLAVAGGLVTDPSRAHEGMRELMRGNSLYFAKSLLGRGLLRMLARQPDRLLQQAIMAKRAATNYGKWLVISHGERFVEMKHEDEYVWIESALLGGAAGMFEACGISPQVEVSMIDPFNGSLLFRW
jgi:uncharacterized protein (TIGR02265 family)